MRYFIYRRKSSDREDKQILGPEAQRRLMTEYAERHGLDVVDIYVEHKTACKTGRPLFGQMLARLEAGEAEGILTYHLTRLARNSFDGGRLIYMMDEGHVRQIATPERAYTDNADDKFLMQIHFAMAKKSSDDTSQFVRRDVESKLLKGEYPGQVPLGYLNVNRDGHITRAQDDMDKYLALKALGRPLRREEIDPVDGPLMKMLFEEVAGGRYSAPMVGRLAYRMGLRSRRGRRLNKNTVVSLLANPYYHGVIRHGGKVYDDETIRELSGNPAAAIQHEPLVSKTLFDQVQDALFARRKGRYRKHTYTFGGCAIRCGECGASVTAERQKGIVYYHCTGTRDGCSQRRWMPEGELESQFSEVLSALRLPQAYVDYAFSRLRRVHAAETKASRAMRQKLRGQLGDVEQKLDALLQLRISAGNRDGSLLSDEEYLRQKGLIRGEIALLKERLATIEGQSDTWIDDCERFLDFTQRLVQIFRKGAVEDRKALLNVVCSNLTLTDRTLDFAYREPYASLAVFPLAGDGGRRRFEPDSARTVAENPRIMAGWLHIPTVIRTYPLREYAVNLGSR